VNERAGTGALPGVRMLLVLPVERGTGEIITAIQVATDFVAAGGVVRYLASPLAKRLVEPSGLGAIVEMGSDGRRNAAAWHAAVDGFAPDIIMFMDYPLMFFPSGCVPLAAVPGWVETLENTDVLLVTTDHFGFAQSDRGHFFGPPHLGFHTYYRAPALPRGMRVLLPCPMHDPGMVPGRIGQPFRYWDVPLTQSEGQRLAVRQRYLTSPEDKLVFHFVPRWAIEGVRLLKLPFYEYFAELLDLYLGGLDAPVHVVSVNDGNLLRTRPGSRVRFTNLAPLSAPEFEAHLLGSDLALTENGMSISLGKAVCARQPCAALINSFRLIELLSRVQGPLRRLIATMESALPGTVYPYSAFPSVTPKDVEAIGLYRDNPIREAFHEVEVFGGDETRRILRDLLFDDSTRSALRARQTHYIDGVRSLPNTNQAMALWLATSRMGP
jgi:hypothetical protein